MIIAKKSDVSFKECLYSFWTASGTRYKGRIEELKTATDEEDSRDILRDLVKDTVYQKICGVDTLYFKHTKANCIIFDVTVDENGKETEIPLSEFILDNGHVSRKCFTNHALKQIVKNLPQTYTALRGELNQYIGLNAVDVTPEMKDFSLKVFDKYDENATSSQRIISDFCRFTLSSIIKTKLFTKKPLDVKPTVLDGVGYAITSNIKKTQDQKDSCWKVNKDTTPAGIGNYLFEVINQTEEKKLKDWIVNLEH